MRSLRIIEIKGVNYVWGNKGVHIGDGKIDTYGTIEIQAYHPVHMNYDKDLIKHIANKYFEVFETATKDGVNLGVFEHLDSNGVFSGKHYSHIYIDILDHKGTDEDVREALRLLKTELIMYGYYNKFPYVDSNGKPTY